MERTSDSDSEQTTSTKSWLGTSMPQICNERGPWCFHTSPVKPSRHHCVLYEPSSVGQGQPAPHYNTGQLAWDDEHVRMPFSPKNLFPVKENGVDVLKPRWDIIKKALSEPINSTQDLEKAMSKYTTNLPKLEALHNFFNTILEEEETAQFFTCLLPGIIDLALHLPEIVTSNIPLLKKNQNKAVSLSQVQIASLMANAFLCTFPWSKDIAASYPGVNFVRLFAAHSRPRRLNCIAEKLKCICHYFRRVLSKYPTGVVTFERKYIPKSNMPRWDTMDKNLGNTKIHIDSYGTIEDNGLGCLQIDFANKYIGGGVLGYGCVQEEIRFVICPELIISRLFIEQLGDNEAVVITGVERYSKYDGYSDDFTWTGNFVDETPFDEFGRRKTSIAVIDATHYRKASDQFYPSAMLRELNKAYVGFSSRGKENLAPVATGNWGCGAYKGSRYLKALLQLMACCAANRDLIYYSFGDEQLRDDFYNMHLFLGNNQITVMQLWKFLSGFVNTKLSQDNLYSYIQQSYFDSKTQKTVKDYFKSTSNNNISSNSPAPVPSTSKRENSSNEAISMEVDNFSQTSSYSDDIIPSSQPSEEIPIKPVKSQLSFKKKLPSNHEDIVNIIEAMEGKQENKNKTEMPCEDEILSCFDELDKVKKKSKSNDIGEVTINIEDDSDLTMDLDNSECSSISSSAVEPKKSAAKKITDYFAKISKAS